MGCCESAIEIGNETTTTYHPPKKKEAVLFYVVTTKENEVKEECCICFDPMHQYVYLPCAHKLHHDCAMQWFRSYRHSECPICRTNIYQKPNLLEQDPEEQDLEQEPVQEGVVDDDADDESFSESFSDTDTSEGSDGEDTDEEQDSDRPPAAPVPNRLFYQRQEEHLQHVIHQRRSRRPVRQAWIQIVE